VQAAPPPAYAQAAALGAPAGFEAPPGFALVPLPQPAYPRYDA
jgi:hypothetical protein